MQDRGRAKAPIEAKHNPQAALVCPVQGVANAPRAVCKAGTADALPRHNVS
jgi:hypothetical protein